MDTTSSTRINKYLAHAAGYSRREADDLVSQGRVTINGQKAVMGSQVKPTDEIRVNGSKIIAEKNYTYLLFHKPVGYVCSRRAQGHASTIYELLPKNLHSLKTVGRLDRDSSGLLLLTDDGDFSHRMTHPSFHKTKVYEVELDKPLEPLHQQMISDYGVTLDDGVSRFQVTPAGSPAASAPEASAFPAAARQDLSAVNAERGSGTEDNRDERTSLEVIMHEGRNRQIRRTFAALGYTVTRLHRTTFGPYTLNNLKSGHHEKTTAK